MADPVAELLAGRGDPAAVAWAHEGKGDVAKVADPLAAIAAAERLGNVAALQSVTAPKPLKKAAAAALHRLRSRGVKVAEKVERRVAGLTREVVDVPPRAVLTLPDEEGVVEIVCATTDADGTWVYTAATRGPGHPGYARLDRWGRNETRQTLDAMRRDGGAVELPFVAALDLALRWSPPETDDRVEFLKHVDPAHLAAAEDVDAAGLYPPAGKEFSGAPWIYPPDVFEPAALDARAEALNERLRNLAGTLAEGPELAEDEEAVPPDATAAIEASALELADALTPEGRAHLADVAEFGATIRRWHGAVRAAEALETSAQALRGDVPAREIPGLAHAARRAVLARLIELVETEGEPALDDGDYDFEDEDLNELVDDDDLDEDDLGDDDEPSEEDATAPPAARDAGTKD